MSLPAMPPDACPTFGGTQTKRRRSEFAKPCLRAAARIDTSSATPTNAGSRTIKTFHLAP